MKVYELIEILKKCDQNTPVAVDVRTNDEVRIVFSVDHVREYGGVVAIEGEEDD